MADRTFLDWPFFEDRHRAFADRLDAWVDAEIAPLTPSPTTTATTASTTPAAAILQALGEGGWLRNAVPVDGPLDVRTLCLTRETLARTLRPGRLRLRHAGPGLRPDQPVRHRRPEGRLAAARGVAAKSPPPSPCPSPRPGPTSPP